MKEQLEKIMKEYDFVGDFDMNEVITKTIAYIDGLEKENKNLNEIISIQRYNLSLYRGGKIKAKVKTSK